MIEVSAPSPPKVVYSRLNMQLKLSRCDKIPEDIHSILNIFNLAVFFGSNVYVSSSDQLRSVLLLLRELS